MKLNDYQKRAYRYAAFEDMKLDPILYLTIGITGEAGEIAEEIKKMIRNDKGKMNAQRKKALQYELGDVLWYVSQLARALGYSLEGIAKSNLRKLEGRRKRGTLKGAGNHR